MLRKRTTQPRQVGVASSTHRTCTYPGLPRRNPGLKLANAFSVIRRALIFMHSVTPRFLYLSIFEDCAISDRLPLQN